MSRYDWAAIRAAYESGASLDVIFERFGADVSHASRKLRAMGVVMRRRGAPRRADYATLAAEYVDSDDTRRRGEAVRREPAHGAPRRRGGAREEATKTRDEIKARHAAWAVEYAAGDSTNIIAKRYAVERVTVFLALRGLGVKMRKGGCSPTVAKARAEKAARIVQLRANGASTVEAARVVGVSACTVRKFARVAGLKKLPSGRPSRRHPRLDEMVRDYAAGDSLKTLAARYGINFSHISRLLRNAGVTMRSRGKPRAIDHDAVIAAYASGRKPADVAREFGISVHTVYHLASAAGVRHYPRPKR